MARRINTTRKARIIREAIADGERLAFIFHGKTGILDAFIKKEYAPAIQRALYKGMNRYYTKVINFHARRSAAILASI